MKQVIILFILSFNSLQAQTITIFIQNNKGEKLEGVSVFDIDDKNNLVAISDINGRLNLLSEKKYVVHLLGYKDSTISIATDLKSITLQNVNYALPEVKIAPTKTKIIHIVEKPEGMNIGEWNSGRRVIVQKLAAVNIPKSGFLRTFSIYAFIAGEGEELSPLVADFLIYENNNGVPGKILTNIQIRGVLKNKRLNFNFDRYSIYLSQGNYFIGFENNHTYTPRKISIGRGMLNLRYRRTQKPELFTRDNFSEWVPFTHKKFKGTEDLFYSFGYELEIEVRAND